MLGVVAGVPLFLMAVLVLLFKRRNVNPRAPFSMHVTARKPVEPV